MRLLNLGCGATRPLEPWINVDSLYDVLHPGSPEREQLDKEKNYVNVDLRLSLPFLNESIDGILMSHFLEHLTLQESVKIVKEANRVLKKDGILRISVPCPKMFHDGTIAGQLDWGEVGWNPSHPLYYTKPYMEIALFFEEHKQVLEVEGLFCILYVSGFRNYEKSEYEMSKNKVMSELDNRQKFSLFVEAVK